MPSKLFLTGKPLIVNLRLCFSRTMPKKKTLSSNKEKEERKNQNPIFLDKYGNISIKVLAKPGAKLNAITGMSEEGVSVQINAPPVEGEANIELIQFISSILKIRKSDITLDKGSRSRNKTLCITSNDSICVESVVEKLKAEIKN